MNENRKGSDVPFADPALAMIHDALRALARATDLPPGARDTYLAQLRRDAARALPAPASANRDTVTIPRASRAHNRRPLRWGQGSIRLTVAASLILAVLGGAFWWVVRPQSVSAAQVLQKAAVAASDPAALGVRSFHYRYDRNDPAHADGTYNGNFPLEEVWGSLPNRWRIEEYPATPPNPRGLGGDNGSGSDGTTEWSYATYRRQLDVRIGALPADATTPVPVVLTVADGAVEPGTMASYLRDCFHPTLAGNATVAGRPAYVLDLGPSSCPVGFTYSGTGTVAPLPPTPAAQQGKHLLWIDTQTYFQLKSEWYKPDGTLEVRRAVAMIEYNITIPDGIFTYTPPLDAQVTDVRPAPYSPPTYPDEPPGAPVPGLVAPAGTLVPPPSTPEPIPATQPLPQLDISSPPTPPSVVRVL